MPSNKRVECRECGIVENEKEIIEDEMYKEIPIKIGGS